MGHTWYDGLQSCKTWSESKAVIAQQLNEAQQQRDGSSEGDGNSAAKPHALTSAPVLGVRPIVALAHTPPGNTSPATASMATAEMWNTSSASVTSSHNPDRIAMTALVRTLVVSQGLIHVLDITAHMSSTLVFVLLAG